MILSRKLISGKLCPEAIQKKICTRLCTEKILYGKILSRRMMSSTILYKEKSAQERSVPENSVLRKFSPKKFLSLGVLQYIKWYGHYLPPYFVWVSFIPSLIIVYKEVIY